MFRFLFLFAGAILLFASMAIATPAQTKPGRSQLVKVDLTERGYQPETFTLRRGIPAYVTFTRKTRDECGEIVFLPNYGIRRTLPLNQPVTIRFTPRSTGTFNFTCGMDMLRGQIIVS